VCRKLKRKSAGAADEKKIALSPLWVLRPENSAKEGLLSGKKAGAVEAGIRGRKRGGGGGGGGGGWGGGGGGGVRTEKRR